MPDRDVVAEAILAIKADLDQRHGENITRAQVSEKLLNELIVRVDGLYHAFPDEDPSGHRRYHDAIVEKMEARAEFYQKLRIELASKGLWALAGLLIVALWSYFKAKVAQ